MTGPAGRAAWWRTAVVYQVYVRSFADSNGDGEGDLGGVRERLPYLKELGIDAIWLTPFYPSPLLDGGYDVADHRDVDSRFGMLADFDTLVADAHQLGIRIIVDVVPNHVSWEHHWFREALATPPGSRAWDRFHCVKGRGSNGTEPPNQWQSVFGGPAWTVVPAAAGGDSGWWYLHLFDRSQPDLNWENPEVAADMRDTLRFWFSRGADGIRIDVATGLMKAPGYPDEGPDSTAHPYWDRDEVHGVYRDWRNVADEFDARVMVGEVILGDADRVARYVRPDELHMAFNFSGLQAPWDAAAMRSAIETPLHHNESVGAPTTWVLENHDVPRAVTRFAEPQDTRDPQRFPTASFGSVDEPHLLLGRARARAALMLFASLPGSFYLYNGQELALPEVADLPDEARQDPIFARTGGQQPGRDGCRVPLPWGGYGANAGFGPPGGDPSWLPQPAGWDENSVQRQRSDPASMLRLAQEVLQLRRSLGLGGRELRWRDDLDPQSPDLIVVDLIDPHTPAPTVRVALNLSDKALDLPPGEVLLTSADADPGRLAANGAVWLEVGGPDR